jgi:hypothetical protein
MSQTVSPYAAYMAPAFIGMKADSMEDNVESFACAAAGGIPFGVVVGRSVANAITIQPGNGVGAQIPVGVSLHDHIAGVNGGYLQYDAVSVLTRGRVWARIKSGTVGIADGVSAFFDATTGEFTVSGTGPIAYPHAVYRSAMITIPVVGMSTYGSGLAAIVELHYPTAP